MPETLMVVNNIAVKKEILSAKIEVWKKIITICITREVITRKNDKYANFLEGKITFLNLGIIMYPIPIISKVRNPSI